MGMKSFLAVRLQVLSTFFWVRTVVVLLLVISFLCFFFLRTDARYINSYRDTISTSAPDVFANHTIEFEVTTTIPAGGYVRIRLGDGDFSIPLETFDQDQVQFSVAPPSLAYTERPATSTADALYDGVAITYGSTAQIDITLNGTEGLAVGDRVRILLGSHTSNSTTTDTGIRNPVATGTQPVYIEAGNGSTALASARGLIAIIENIGMGADTTEDVPPVRFEGAPSGSLSGLVTTAEISFETDEFATCRYSSESGVDYLSMTDQFTNTGSVFHSYIWSNLLPETTYTIYVRCVDDELNYNTDDYEITFTIEPFPEGEPGGGDDSSTGGTGEGSGSGTTGAGDGSSDGDTDASESQSGGSRGGGGGGGGLTSDDSPYESGDAKVVVSGYAFPGSRATLLVDGDAVEENITVGASGSFTTTIDAIARGVYTFGVYATDRNGTKSSTFSTTFSVAGARTSTLSNIHLMPTIVASPNPVSPGATVTFSGYAIPNSTVTLENQQDKTSGRAQNYTASSDASGKWTFAQPTTGFAQGTWKIRAKSEQANGGISTNYSQYTFYSVGGSTPVPASGSNSDLNRDSKVNLIDFSILLFHWNTAGGSSNPPADINRDGKVSLTDFSIMIFNWTG